MRNTASSEGQDKGLARSVAAGAAAFLAGAGVMLFEFHAVRFLQRFFGSSVEVWASVISVCLAGLALGYVIGGFVADRWPSWRPMGVAFIVGGLTALPMEKLTKAIADRLLNIDHGLEWHPLIAALASSFLPILALGTVLPMAIRLHVRRLDRVGAGAGWVTAASTLGSIAGTLATTHLLWPRWGVREALYGAAGTLVLIGVAVLAAGWKRRAPVALLIVAWVALPARAEILFEDYSAYHHILVEDVDGERRLRFDNEIQSTMSLADPYAGGFEYTEFFHVPMMFDPTIRTVLFIGLGGGTGPKAFFRDYPQVQVDVAEIDPMVLRVARRYFDVPRHARLDVTIADGRVHLRRSKKRFGAIIVDAYASSPYGPYLPYQLVTVEFFRLAWSRLVNGGCVVYNVVGVCNGKYDDLVRAVYATLQTTFQTVYAFQAKTSLNTVFVAVKIDPRTLQPDGTRDGYLWPAGPWLAHPLTKGQLRTLARASLQRRLIRVRSMWRLVAQMSHVTSSKRPGQVLTDNYAPVDIGTSLQGFSGRGRPSR